MQVCVLVANRVFDTGLASVLDTLQTATDLTPAAKAASAFRVSVCGVRKRVLTQHGLGVPLAPLPRARPDVVIVPALGAKSPDTLAAALAQHEVSDLGQQLAEWSRAGSLVAAACTATFVVAQAGLLDGRAATTSWWLGPCFRQRYPRVALDDSKLVVLRAASSRRAPRFRTSIWRCGSFAAGAPSWRAPPPTFSPSKIAGRSRASSCKTSCRIATSWSKNSKLGRART
jgi:transcriptional regulator GlxA family with amidase domain